MHRCRFRNECAGTGGDQEPLYGRLDLRLRQVVVQGHPEDPALGGVVVRPKEIIFFCKGTAAN